MVHRHGSRTVEFPLKEECVAAVVSDTHGRPHANLFVVIEEHRPCFILHAGDVGGRDVIERLETLSPTIYVRGNVDPSGRDWPDSFSVSVKLGEEMQADFLLLHIAFARLRLNETARALVQRHPAQTLIFGHSHVPFIGREGKVALFNPGSAGPARFALPTTVGVMKITRNGITFEHLDLRTGKAWRPETART
jgi:uncharacterized protein